MGILQQLLNAGSIVFWVDYLSGSLLDKISGTAPTVGSNTKLGRNGLMGTGSGAYALYVVSTLGTSTISSVQLMDVNYGYHPSSGGGGYHEVFTLSSSGTANSMEYQLGATAAQMSLVSAAVVNVKGKRSLGFSLTSGSKAQYYADGLWVAQSGANVTILDSLDRIYVGNWESPGIYYSMNPVKQILLFNKLLSATEHAQIYGELSLPHASTTGSRTIIDMAPLRDSNLVVDLSLKPVSGVLTDQSASGNNATLYGPVYERHPYLGDSLKFDDVDDYASINDAASITFGNGTTDLPFSVEVIGKFRDMTSSPLLAKGVYNTDAEYRLLIHSDDKINWQMFDESVPDCYIGRQTNAITAYENLPIHIIATYSGSKTSAGCKIYVNGAQADTATAENNAVSYVAMEDLAANLHIGRNDALYVAGSLYTINMIKRELSATEVSSRYNKLKQIGYVADYYALDSTAAEGGTTGAYLSNTPWKFGDASFRGKISSEMISGRPVKSILCSTAGIVYMPISQLSMSTSEAAYGEWEFSIYKALDANQLDVLLTADTIGAANAAGQDGYGLRFASDETIQVIESTAGTPAALITSAAKSIATWYTVRVTRTVAGVFCLYVDNTYIRTATDTTGTTAGYLVIDMDAGDKVAWASEDGKYSFRKRLFA